MRYIQKVYTQYIYFCMALSIGPNRKWIRCTSVYIQYIYVVYSRYYNIIHSLVSFLSSVRCLYLKQFRLGKVYTLFYACDDNDDDNIFINILYVGKHPLFFFFAVFADVFMYSDTGENSTDANLMEEIIASMK